MDCSRARHLVSPYLDQQLTGLEMLEMQQHLVECSRCAEDYASARQVKLLLRSLDLPRPESSFETRILTRLALEERRPVCLLPPRSALPAVWPLVPTVHLPLPAPSRSRQLTGALALSCLAILTVAAPFAPSTLNDTVRPDRVSLGQSTVLEPMPSAGLRAVSAVGDPWDRTSAGMAAFPAGAAVPSAQEATFVRRDVQPALTDSGAEPLGDVAASDYVSGDVAFVGYRTR